MKESVFNWKTLLLIVLVLLNILLMYKVHKGRIELYTLKQKTDYEINKYNKLIRDFIKYESNNVEMNFVNELTKNDGSILIFEFSELDCLDCYLYVFDYLKEVFGDTLDNKVIIYSDFKINRSFEVFKRQHGLKDYKITNIYPNVLMNVFNDYQSPCLFLYRKSGQVDFMYFPNQYNKENTLRYLNAICAKIK